MTPHDGWPQFIVDMAILAILNGAFGVFLWKTHR